MNRKTVYLATLLATLALLLQGCTYLRRGSIVESIFDNPAIGQTGNPDAPEVTNGQ
jgi:hypothetical protein